MNHISVFFFKGVSEKGWETAKVDPPPRSLAWNPGELGSTCMQVAGPKKWFFRMRNPDFRKKVSMEGKIWYVCAPSLSHVLLFATPWTIARQAPLSVGFPRQECWNGLPLSPMGDHPYWGIEPASPASPTLAGRFFTTEPPGKPMQNMTTPIKCSCLNPWNLEIHYLA